MAQLPGIVVTAFDEKEGPAIFATVDAEGVPNVAYVMPFKIIDGDKIAISDHYLNKTRTNILAGSKGALLFITKENTPYQIKGSLDYQTSGPIFDDMKASVGSQHPGVAVVVLNVHEVYGGGQRLEQ
jgi:predicted pyridoxine 5'-phosphate oxidase superfamily flavin-nucleotide-binding protein